jgi:site-specific DNA-methyltransferase (adenine-specific)
VKGGYINASHIRDLRGTIESKNAVIGAFITLEEPTKPMKKEALEAGLYIPEYFPDLKVPRLQILTIEGLLVRNRNT